MYVSFAAALDTIPRPPRSAIDGPVEAVPVFAGPAVTVTSQYQVPWDIPAVVLATPVPPVRVAATERFPFENAAAVEGLNEGSQVTHAVALASLKTAKTWVGV